VGVAPVPSTSEPARRVVDVSVIDDAGVPVSDAEIVVNRVRVAGRTADDGGFELDVAEEELGERDFVEFAELSPLVTVDAEGVSVAGSNLRFNNIQIDGALNQDVFGLSPSGVAGGQARGRVIPMRSCAGSSDSPRTAARKARSSRM